MQQWQAKSFGLAAIAALVAVGWAPTVRAESLESIVREALETSPELAAIRFNRRAIDNELNAARGLNLPTFDVRGDVGTARDSQKTKTGEVTDPYHDRQGVSTVLSQRLFDGFESRHEIARQQHRVESARWRVNDTANSIALRAVQAYLEVIRSQTVLGSARANLSAHQGLLSRISQRADAGKATASDDAEAGARTENAKALVAEAEARHQDALALFKAVVGRMPAGLEGARPAKGLPEGVEQAVSEAKAAAPSVVATQHDATAALVAVGSAYSRFSPKLNLEMTTDHGWGTTEDGNRDIEARAMVVVRWNLFNGGIDKARIWEAKARAAEAGEISANTQRIVERETRVSWNSMIAASKRVPSLQRQLDLQRARRATYLEQFDAGQRRLLDLLDSQAEVFVTESSLRTEELIGVFSGYRVLASMGRIVPAMGIDLPGEATTPPAANLIEGWRTEVQAWPREDFSHSALRNWDSATETTGSVK